MSETQDGSIKKFQPITPFQLKENGIGVEKFELEKEFDHNCNWENTYRMVAAWGNDPNKASYQFDYGYLKIAMTVIDDKRRLEVNQEIITKDLTLMKVQATIILNSKVTHAIESWEKQVTAYDDTGKIILESSMMEKGYVTDEKMKIERGLHTIEKRITGRIADLWTMMAAVQNRDKKQTNFDEFMMLEWLTILRSNQHYYPHNEEVDCHGKLYRTYQIGKGIIPIDYWTNQQGRLCYVTTGNLAWVLDRNAEKKFETLRRCK